MNHAWMPSSHDPCEGSAKLPTLDSRLHKLPNFDYLYAIADKVETNVMESMMSNVLQYNNNKKKSILTGEVPTISRRNQPGPGFHHVKARKDLLWWSPLTRSLHRGGPLPSWAPNVLQYRYQ